MFLHNVPLTLQCFFFQEFKVYGRHYYAVKMYVFSELWQRKCIEVFFVIVVVVVFLPLTGIFFKPSEHRF